MGQERENVRYEAAAGRPGRALIVRLPPGSDLVGAMLQACEDYGIRNGYVSTCIGSLSESRFVYGSPDPSLKSRAGYSPEQVCEHLTQVLSGQGTICHDEMGEIQIHLHLIFCDQGLVRGGHFDKPGNTIATTMELAIQEVLGVEMTRPFDPEIDLNRLHPEAVSEE